MSSFIENYLGSSGLSPTLNSPLSKIKPDSLVALRLAVLVVLADNNKPMSFREILSRLRSGINIADHSGALAVSPDVSAERLRQVIGGEMRMARYK